MVCMCVHVRTWDAKHNNIYALPSLSDVWCVCCSACFASCVACGVAHQLRVTMLAMLDTPGGAKWVLYMQYKLSNNNLDA